MNDFMTGFSSWFQNPIAALIGVPNSILAITTNGQDYSKGGMPIGVVLGATAPVIALALYFALKGK